MIELKNKFLFLEVITEKGLEEKCREYVVLVVGPDQKVKLTIKIILFKLT